MIHRPSAEITHNILYNAAGNHSGQCCGERYNSYGKDYRDNSRLVYTERKMCHLTAIYLPAHYSPGILNRYLSHTKSYINHTHDDDNHYRQEEEHLNKLKTSLGCGEQAPDHTIGAVGDSGHNIDEDYERDPISDASLGNLFTQPHHERCPRHQRYNCDERECSRMYSRMDHLYISSPKVAGVTKSDANTNSLDSSQHHSSVACILGDLFLTSGTLF